MAKKEEKNNKDKKSFMKSFKAELKKVIWPTPKQVVNNTTAVVVIVLITALIVFVLDLTFETLNTHGVNRLKSIVRVEENVIDNNTVDNTTNTIDEKGEQETDANTVPEE